MKKVWLAQPTNMLANSVFLPYSVGAIAAYAWQFQDIKDTYALQKFIFLKEPIEDTVSLIDEPFLLAFSCYMWNVEYNLAVARAVKERWKNCLVVLGGPQIPRDLSFLEDNDCIDILIFGEGEETFCSLLRSLRDAADLSDIKNIAFRKDGTPVMTSSSFAADISHYPSPYAEGYFDYIFDEDRYKGLQLDVILETNRGCPYKCLYCSWGDNEAPLRTFSMEKIKQEINWFSEHKIPYCVCADGNFGIFQRDIGIAEYLVKTKKQTGYPQKFENTAAKDKDDIVFRINKILSDAGMNRGVSVSCQSMSPEVLKNIGRKNMSVGYFSAQLKKYREADIATYTDLILGLPGETFDSFCKGLFAVIDAGQHFAVNISRCELLPNSPMYSSAIIQKYGIKTIKSYLCQNHSKISTDNIPGSRSEIVVETNSMSRSDWRKMCRLSSCVQGLHFFGLLRFIAIYLRQSLNVSYYDFYLRLYSFIENENTYLRSILDHANGSLDLFLQNKSNIFFADSRFGNIYIPLEEGMFLCCASEHERFYDEMFPCLQEFFPDSELFNDLYRYQRCAVTLPGISEHTETFSYDWLAYFDHIYDPLPRQPEKRQCTFLFNPERYDDLEDYAREIVWYGKRNNKTIVSDIRPV